MELHEIQKMLKAPKNQRNNFGNYNYRSCEDILEAVKPLLGNSTLTISDKVIMLGDRFYVEATVTLCDNGVQKKVTAYAREEEAKKGMDGAQITGAASSYARKYALNGLFLIDDTKDPDTREPENKNQQQPNVNTKAQPPTPKITAAQHQFLEATISEIKADREAIKKFYKLEHITDMTAEQMNQVVRKLNGKKE